MHRAVFFFKTPYFIIIHLTFITVTHYKMYVRLIHFQGPRLRQPFPMEVISWVCPWAWTRQPVLVSPVLGGTVQERTSKALAAGQSCWEVCSAHLGDSSSLPCCLVGAGGLCPRGGSVWLLPASRTGGLGCLLLLLT